MSKVTIGYDSVARDKPDKFQALAELGFQSGCDIVIAQFVSIHCLGVSDTSRCELYVTEGLKSAIREAAGLIEKLKIKEVGDVFITRESAVMQVLHELGKIFPGYKPLHHFSG